MCFQLDMVSEKLTSEIYRFCANTQLHESLKLCDNVQVSIALTYHHLKLNIWIWKPTNFLVPWKCIYLTFTMVLRLQWGVSYKKLFLCAVRHLTSASHLTHCKIISLSLSRDELCPGDKLQRWISIIVSLLRSFCGSGVPALKASNISYPSLDIFEQQFSNSYANLQKLCFRKKVCPSSSFEHITSGHQVKKTNDYQPTQS